MSSPALEKALQLIKDFEGCRLQAYQDQRGRWTVGYGCTGAGIAAGTVWTQEEADDALAARVQTFLKTVQGAFKDDVLNDDQAAALTSFCYNVGEPDFKRSGVVRFLRLRDPLQAGLNLLLWNHAGNYFDFGLYRRRVEELFFGWPDVARKIGVAE